jgi:elongator complex protein 3
MKKFARTISGVAPLAVMTKPMDCPGECVYCPTYRDTPQSYTPESPAVLRAIKCDYDARKQVEMRLGIFSGMGHPTDKMEMIIMGGTFLAQPVDYQYEFIKGCYDGLNGMVAASLEEARRINETASNRCTGLCIETRPDWCGEEEIRRMLEFGATRVELGVQTLSDDIYRLVKRGHLVEDVVKANALLRDHGFKVYYHWMPGLPGATPEMDLELSGKLFDDENHRPDGLKIYPTMVVEDTGLEKWWLEGRYQPYSNNTMIDLTIGIKTLVPKYVRISRVLRDIPSKFIVAGLKDSLRDIARERMKRDSLECRCIRCREYGHRANAGWAIGEPQLVRMDYDVCGGKEIFLSFEDEKETLFGLLRLRIPPRTVPVLQNGRNDAIALVRELHVFGPQVPLSEQREDAAQHKGLGRALLLKAEDIALNEFHVDRMVILSGVGAREYYRNDFGYSLEGDYMVKNLKNRD